MFQWDLGTIDQEGARGAILKSLKFGNFKAKNLSNEHSNKKGNLKIQNLQISLFIGVLIGLICCGTNQPRFYWILLSVLSCCNQITSLGLCLGQQKKTHSHLLAHCGNRHHCPRVHQSGIEADNPNTHWQVHKRHVRLNTIYYG